MASWDQGATQTSFNAQEYADSIINARSGSRSGGTSGSSSGGGFLSGLFGGNSSGSSYSVVGINVNEIPNMRNAIREYVEEINTHLSQINASTDSGIALKGAGIDSAIKEYVQAVAKYCGALTSTLLAFSDKLAKVQAAWEASDANISGTVRGSAEELNGTASQFYTEQSN